MNPYEALLAEAQRTASEVERALRVLDWHDHHA